MPELGTRCVQCKTIVPEALPSRMLVDLLHMYFAQAQKTSSRRIPISLDAHLPRKGYGEGNLPKSQFEDSRAEHLTARHHDSTSWHFASHPNENTINGRTPGAAVALTTCLQQEGMQQSKCDAITQIVKFQCGHAVDESPATENPVGSVTDMHVNASQVVGESVAQKVQDGSVAGMTMMICNIPCRVHYEELIEAIEEMRFGGKFEFVHIPCRFGQSRTNLGYAFIHFFQRADAESFARAFEGYHFACKRSTKACTVKVASYQGSNGSPRRMNRKLRLAQKDDTTTRPRNSCVQERP